VKKDASVGRTVLHRLVCDGRWLKVKATLNGELLPAS
jgi:hypothetical protein